MVLVADCCCNYGKVDLAPLDASTACAHVQRCKCALGVKAFTPENILSAAQLDASTCMQICWQLCYQQHFRVCFTHTQCYCLVRCLTYQPKAARMARGAAYAADLAARQQLAAAAAGAAHLAPKETQEWAEAGWWKCQGQMAPAGLIPRKYSFGSTAQQRVSKVACLLSCCNGCCKPC